MLIETDMINGLTITGLSFLGLITLFALLIGFSVLWKHGTQPNTHTPSDRRHGCDRDQVVVGEW